MPTTQIPRKTPQTTAEDLPLQVYVGWDRREDAAYHVCVASILQHTPVPVQVHILDEHALRVEGLYWRPQRKRSWGGGTDLLDGKPFSTDFAFTRFLVPYLAGACGWALFVDCDFLFRASLTELFALADPRYAVMCVKHDHSPLETTKMDGAVQERYRRKNWSSLMLFNCAKADMALSPASVSTQPGSFLHGFQWLADEEIGELPVTWNWLAGTSSNTIDPKAVHFTKGWPGMVDHQVQPYADEWRAVYNGERSS